MGAAKRAGSLLCAAALLLALAACGPLDEGPSSQNEAEPESVAMGTLPREEPLQLPTPQQADNSTLVTITNGVGLAGQSAAGGDEGFYQTVKSGDGKAAYILYTDYATATTGWLLDDNGMPIRIPVAGSEVAILPAGDIVLVLRLGNYEWGDPGVGAQIYTMQPNGSNFTLAVEMPYNRVFWPTSAVVYDGEGIYCNVAHYNGAKGTADMMLMYIYEDGHDYVEMKYYPMEYEVPLLAGSFGSTMILRTAESEDFWGPGTVQQYEDNVTNFSYSLYHYGGGAQSEPVATYANTNATGFVEGDRLYTVYAGGGVIWYDFSTGQSGQKLYEFPVGGTPRPAKSTGESYAAVWNGNLVVTLGGTAYRLDTYQDDGWQQTGGYNPAEYSGAIWAASSTHYVVAASEEEDAYYTAGMELFGLEEEEEQPQEDEEDTVIQDTAVPVWLRWPFPEERPADMTLFLLAEADGYWQGPTQRVPLLPN